jgi:hypothetical protein
MILLLLFTAGAALAAAQPDPPHRSFPNIPTLFLRTPGENVLWPAGSQQEITWTSMDFPGPTAKIILLKNNITVITVITGVMIENQSYSWRIPADLPPGPDYQLRIISERYAYCKDISYKFAITAPQ